MTKHKNELKEYLKRPESAEDKVWAILVQLAIELGDAEQNADGHHATAERLNALYEKALADGDIVFADIYYREAQKELALEADANAHVQSLLRLVKNI